MPVDWHALTDAYGPADGIPRAIEDLASNDDKLRDEAYGKLESSLCHQGTLYSATAPAIPLLFVVMKQPGAGRGFASTVLEAIAEASTVDPADIRRTWAWRKEKLGEIYPRPTSELMEAELAAVSATRAALDEHLAEIEALTSDGEEVVARRAKEILTTLRRARRTA